MAINSSAAPPRVGDKMRYAIPVAIADWKRLFSGETAKPAVPVETPKRKPPARKTSPKVKPERGTEPRRKSPPEAAALVFIKKEPVTFQVRRQEHPEDFERMVFVVKACAKNGGNKALSVLHVEQIREGSWLAASDGKRLHAAFTQRKIRSGDYKPVITRDTVSLGEPVTGIMFPNWRRVIPGDTVKRGTIDLADSGWGKDRSQTEKLSVAFNAFVRQTGELVNLRYLEDLAKKRWALHCQRIKNRAIMLKAEGVKEDMFAVIMPLTGEAATEAA